MIKKSYTSEFYLHKIFIENCNPANITNISECKNNMAFVFRSIPDKPLTDH